MDTGKENKLGIWMTTSLVVGNMIGAGVFLLPAALAGLGGIGLVGWGVSAVGALILARVLGRLSTMVRGSIGGPYAYARAGFGPFAGFLVAWGYWNSIWIANGAITVAFIGAMGVLFPALETHPLAGVGTGLAALWLLTWVNALGITRSGRMQVVTTLLKLLPMAAVIFGGLLMFDPQHLLPFNTSGRTGLGAIAASGALTLYAFLGLESATVPADKVRNPNKTIPRATLLGTLVATVVYVLSTLAVMGMIPLAELATSPAPFADAMRLLAGPWGGGLVAGGMAVAAFGALNGWILIQSQVGRATARDGLFPAVFSRENKHEVPVFGLVAGSVLSSLLVLMHLSESLVEQFSFMILLSTLCTLVPYLFSAAAYLRLSGQSGKSRQKAGVWVLGGLALAFSAWAVYGAGLNAVLWGLALLLSGVPVYAYMATRQTQK